MGVGPVERPRDVLVTERKLLELAPGSRLELVNSERAIVDGGILAEGQFTWFWGFEITNSLVDRTTDAKARWGGNRLAVSSRTAVELAGLDAGRWFGPASRSPRAPRGRPDARASTAPGRRPASPAG